MHGRKAQQRLALESEGCHGAMYPLPAGNGLRTEIGDNYIKGLCRKLGIDPDDFLKKLRG